MKTAPDDLLILLIFALASALLLCATLLAWRMRVRRASLRRFAAALEQRAPLTPPTSIKPARQRLQAIFEHLGKKGAQWLDTPAGKQIVAAEDRRLLDQCGFTHTHARGLFMIARLACMGIFIVVFFCFFDGSGLKRYAVCGLALVLGFMLPKIFIKRRARARCNAIVDELPMLIDLLRLFQGIGLAIDQSLQLMIHDFRGVLPTLAGELEIAQRQFAAGRTREQSLHHLARTYENEDLSALVRLLVQIDRHGGAVQEPLKQFAERLRETRRAMLRERVGRMTVKMTVVMIVTLLPALLLIAAGPGMLAVVRVLKTIQH